MSAPRWLAGRYRLDEALGQGALGEVWRAWDVVLDREVALKRLKLAESGFDALRAELRAAATVRHPHLVRIFDLIARPGGPALCATELLDAVPFDVAAAGLPSSRVLELAHQALDALTHLHAAGVLHAALKPSNLLVDRRTRRHLTLVDFGHAGARALRGLHGAPAYLAPEVVRGGAHDVRSELYALGAVLYEALTGGNPFVGADAVETLGRQIDHVPTPAHHARPDVTPAASALLARLLDKHPSRRPSSFAAARDALGALLTPEAAAPAARRRPLATPPLSGRGDAMTAAQVLVAGLEVGSGACLAALGTPGSGRSRFADELRLAAELQGRPTGAVRFTGRPSDHARLDAAIAAMIGASAEGDALKALASFVREVPAAIVIDDADHASPSLFPRLGRLLQLAREAPLLVGLTYGDADAPSGERLTSAVGAAAARGYGWEIGLPPLDVEEMQLLVDGALGGEADPGTLVEPLQRATAGLPGAATTLLDQLAWDGALERRAGIWHADTTALPGTGRATTLPAAHDLRAAALPEAPRLVLAALAALGEASAAELTRVSGLDGVRTQRALDDLVVARLVRPHHDDAGVARFDATAPALARRALAHIDGARRRTLVRAAATTISPGSPRARGDRAVRVAEAALAIGDAAVASAIAPEAAERAEERGDAELALTLWRGLAALTEDPARAREAQLARARLAFAAGELDEVLESLEPLSAPPLDAQCLRAEALGRLGRADEARERASALLDLANEAAAPTLRLRLAVTAARVLRRIGAPGVARRAVETGLSGADEQAAPGALAALLGELAALDTEAGRADDAVVEARRAMGLALRSNDPRAIGDAAMILGAALRAAGRADEALAIYADAARGFAAVGALSACGDAKHAIGACHREAGRDDEAVAAWHGALRDAEVTARRDAQIALLTDIGALHLARGAHALADERLGEALSLASTPATAALRLTVLGHLADLRMRQGAHATAHEHLDEAIALAAERGSRAEAIASHRRRAELLLLEDEPLRASDVARDAVADARALGETFEEARLARLEALAALRLGQVAPARRLLARAAAIGAFPSDGLDGQLLALAQAELELVAGLPERASALVDQVVGALVRLGAAWHADQARLLVARVAARAEALGGPNGAPDLSRAVDLLLEARTAQEVAEHAVALALEACGAEHCTLYLEPTPAHEALRVSTAAPRLTAREAEVGAFSHTVARRVLADGASVCLQHVEDDRIVARAESVIAMHVRSVLCVAIPLEGRVGGLVYLDSRVHVGDRFQRALPTVERLAGLVGVAIERMRLRDRVASQTGLLSVVAHELRSPMTTLMGFAELATASDGPDAVAHAATLVGVVLEEGRRMQRLVDDVSALGRAWRFNLDKAAEVTARMLLEGARRRARPAAAARGVQLLVEIADDLPTIYADTERIQQVLGNLIENALRHSPSGADVLLRATREPYTGHVGERRALRFSVYDEGPGIGPEDAAAIFQRFNRGSRPIGSGTGLGLSIAQSIVHAHGGRIWVEARRPGGRLHFTLPVALRPRTGG